MRGEFAAADQDLDPILRASPENFMANYPRGLKYVKQQNYIAASSLIMAGDDLPSFPCMAQDLRA